MLGIKLRSCSVEGNCFFTARLEEAFIIMSSKAQEVLSKPLRTHISASVILAD